MASEKRRLVRNGSRKEDGNFDYGSISYQRIPQNEDEDDLVQVKFVYKKRDAIIVGILTILVAISITTTLMIGIPNIRRKEAALNLYNTSDFLSTSSLVTNVPSEPPRLKAAMAPAPGYPPVSNQGKYAKAGVATNCEECSQIGVEILERGGSTMDAVIAATVCLSVVDLHHTGLGGGFLMTVYDRASRTAKIIDARETAPSLATQSMYHGDPTLSSEGGLAVAVPSLVKGLWVAHQMYGKLNWSELIEPSILLAEKGFRIGLSLADALKKERRTILKDENLRSILANRWGEDVLKYGDIIKQPVLAKTLRRLAEEGGEDMYSGSLAHSLVQDIQKLGGIVTLEDLQNYTVKVEEPVSVELGHGHFRMFSVPPPGSGALVAFFLNVMEGYNWTYTSLEGDDDAILGYHRITEGFKFTYAKRTFVGDPDFVNISQLMMNLTSKSYASSIRNLIVDDKTFPPDYYGADTIEVDDHGTSHVSAIGPNGDSVTITSTINQKFGAKVMSKSTGIILNDEMDDFSSPDLVNYFDLPPSPANFIVPGKRPLSSMCPTIVVDTQGDVLLATGASGGSKITSSTAYVMLRFLYLDHPLGMATDSPRIHHQLYPNEVEIEMGLSAVVIEGLQKIGHFTKLEQKSATAVNSIRRRPKGGVEAVGDRRVNATVDGF